MTKRVVIVGGGYAGLMAAATLARQSSAAQITLVDAQPMFNQRIRFHELLAGRQQKRLAYAPALSQRGMAFVQGRATQLDPAGQALTLQTEAGPRQLGYDHLIYALGSYTAAPVPGVVEHTLRLDDPQRIQRAALELTALARANGRVLVVGGGATAIEVVTELAERWPSLRMTLVCAAPFGADYAPAAQAHLRQRCAELNITIQDSTSIAAVEAGVAVTTDGRDLPFDLCCWCAGMRAPDLAGASGLAVDGAGRVLVDAYLRAQDYPNIFVAGDAGVPQINGLPLRMGCVSALPMGGYVGQTLAQQLNGQPLAPFQFKFILRCLSLGRRDGLVQWVTPADVPVERVWPGMRARITKALILQMTFVTLRSKLSARHAIAPGHATQPATLEA